MLCWGKGATMSRILGVVVGVVVCTAMLCAAYAQEDGACTVPLVLDAATRAQLEDVLSDSLGLYDLADHGVTAPLLSVSPVADGQISAGEYPNMCFYSFVDRENPGNPYPALDQMDDELGDDDLSLKLHLAHTDQFLFLGFEVTDEFLDLETPAIAWQNDGVELFINADQDTYDFNDNGKVGLLEGFQIIADAAGDGDVDANNRMPDPDVGFPQPIGPSDGVPGEGEFLSAGKPSTTGYVVEFQIPLASLDTDSDFSDTVVPAKTGDVMLMNFSVNDNDVEFAASQDTHAMMWVAADNLSPYGGGEDVWVVPLRLSEAVGPQTPALQPGDADQDLDFDQLDLVRVQIAAKYLTGQAATWGDGDWNGGPGGKQGEPPAGNSRFDQLDIIAALNAGKYLTGPYAAIATGGKEDDGQTSIVYDANTGEVKVDAPAGVQLTSVNIESAASIFTGEPAQGLGGSFDNDTDNNIFKATFGSSFGSLAFGKVAQPGLSQDFVAGDLTVVGSLAGGGSLGNVDLVYVVPEPATAWLAILGLLVLLRRGARSI